MKASKNPQALVSLSQSRSPGERGKSGTDDLFFRRRKITRRLSKKKMFAEKVLWERERESSIISADTKKNKQKRQKERG